MVEEAAAEMVAVEIEEEEDAALVQDQEDQCGLTSKP